MTQHTTISLADIEKALGYTAAFAVEEYRNGTYGDADDWTARTAAEAELDGDAGDCIQQMFGEGHYLEVSGIYREAFVESWHHADVST